MRTLYLLLTLILCSIPADGAFGANTIWAVQSTATATNINGAGFDYGAAFDTSLACTSATGTAPVCTSSYTFVAGDVGAKLFVGASAQANWLNSYAGNTSTTPNGCWYTIASVSGGAATLSAAAGSAVCTDRSQGYPGPRFRPSTVAGVATTASPTSGTWGIDYSQSDTAPFSAADLASTIGTTNPATVTSASVTIGLNWIGNAIHIASGTNWTPGWYECATETSATCTLDRAVGTAASLTAGTYKMGGAASLGSSTTNQTDTTFFSSSHTAAGQRWMIKAGAYSIPSSITTTTGTSPAPTIVEGFTSVRGDAPTVASNMPILSLPSVSITANAYTQLYNLNITSAAASNGVIALNTGHIYLSNLKVVSTSTTAGGAINLNTSTSTINKCELVSYRGYAIYESSTATTNVVQGSYLHDSLWGFFSGGQDQNVTWLNNVFAGNVNGGISWSANGSTNTSPMYGNTFYGSESKMGSGIAPFTGRQAMPVLNNLFYGLTTGILLTDTQFANFDDYNNYYNNTTDVSPQWQKGSHDTAVNPIFASVAEITGSTAVSLASNKLQDSTRNFSALGVVVNQDTVYISGGTGVTAGQYPITAISTTTNPNDTLTVGITLTANATADKVYRLRTGSNFAPANPSFKSGAYPGVLPGGLTQGYLTQGAIDPAGSGGGNFGITQ